MNRKAPQLFLSKASLLFAITFIFFSAKGQEIELDEVDSLLEQAEAHYQFSRFDSALNDYKKVIEAFSNAISTNQYARSLNGVGESFMKLSLYDSALVYLEKAFKYSQNARQKRRIYTNIARYYGVSGDRDKELLYHKKALKIYVTAYGEMNEDAATTIANIGNCYHHKKEYQEALKHYLRSLEIRQAILKDKFHSDYAQSYWIIGRCYGDMGAHHKELIYLQRALRIWVRLYGEVSEPVSRIFYDMGRCYGRIGERNKSYTFLQKSLSLRLQLYGQKHALLAKNHNALGKFFDQEKRLDSALYHYQRALLSLGSSFESTRFSDNPNLLQINDKLKLLETLKLKGDALYQSYTLKGNINHLNDALNTFQMAVRLIDYLRTNIATASALRFLSGNAKSVYEGAIKVSEQLFELTKNERILYQSFEFFEKSRAYLLNEEARDTFARLESGISENMLQREKSIRLAIADLEKSMLTDSIGNHKTESKKMKDLLVDKKLSYDSLMHTLEKQYPKYYESKYNMKVLEVAVIQRELLNTNQALLEYFIGDDAIYIYKITKSEVTLHVVKKDFDLEEWVKLMREGVYGYHFLDVRQRSDSLYERSVKAFNRYAYKLYQKLILPLGSLPDDLIIVPDGELGYLPFNTLLKSQPKSIKRFRDHDYLIYHHKISYAHNVSFLFSNKLKGNISTGSEPGLIAFAPEFESKSLPYQNVESKRRKGLGPLLYNKKEVENISGIIGGDVFTGKKASLLNFFDHAEDYRIIHIASHAKADNVVPELSFVAFSPSTGNRQKLYLSDIYNLELNADMVVLSACETGFGKLYQGEGIASLAQGFAYAGSRAMVTTLWSVDDKATADIMERFYLGISMGKDKSEALYRAQLYYLLNNNIPQDRLHPYFWAAIVPFGDMSPIPLNRDFTDVYTGLMILLSFVVVFVLVKSFKV